MENLVEILKDCPQGTKLYSPIFGEVVFDHITHDEIIVKLNFSNTRCFNRYGQYICGAKSTTEGECMLFPSKNNRDWDTFNVRQNFKKGDFVARVHDGKSTILLMGDTDWSSPKNEVNYICYVDLYNGKFKVSKSHDYWCPVEIFYELGYYRLATDEEKQILLDAIDKNGYVWDEEKLELRKKEHEFKPFEKVLVRDTDINCWTAGFFSHILHDDNTEYRYAVSGIYYKMCIPYEGNEHLLGTTDSPDGEGTKEG